MSETSSSEQDKSLEVLRAMFNGDRLMIIKLRKYNKIRELLIENGTTGSQAQVSYWNGVQEATVTKQLSAWGEGDWDATGYRGTYNQHPSWDREQVCMQALQSNQERPFSNLIR